MLAATLSIPVHSVKRIIPKPEMIGVYAAGNIAFMTDKLTFRYPAPKEHPSNAMSLKWLAVNRELAIAIPAPSSRPKPTAAIRLRTDPVHKLIHNRAPRSWLRVRPFASIPTATSPRARPFYEISHERSISPCTMTG
jgi:hypothetical protein